MGDDSTAELLVKISADIAGLKASLDEARAHTKESTEGMADQFKELGKSIGEIFAAEKVKEWGAESVKEFAAFDSQLRKVQATLGLFGQGTDDNREKIKSWSEDMQRSTLFTKEETLSVLQRMVTATGDLTTSLKLSKLAMDLAATGNIGLEQAGRALGQVYEGNARGAMMLARNFPAMTEVLEKGGDVIGKLQDKFGGLAQKLGTDGSVGANLTHAKEQWNEFGEELAGKHVNEINAVIMAFEDVVKALSGIVTWVIRASQEVGLNLGYMAAKVGAVVDALKGHWKMARAEISDLDRGYAQEHEKIWTDQVEVQKKFDDKMVNGHVKALKTMKAHNDQYSQGLYEAAQRQFNALIKLQEEQLKKQEEADKELLKDAEKLASTLVSLEQSKNKDIAEIGKAFALGKAAIDTAVGVSNALADYPYPESLAVGALVAGEGAVQIAKIEGALDKGGVVSQPTVALIGEKRPELVAPLEDLPKVLAGLGANFGGGSPTIKELHVHGVNDANTFVRQLPGLMQRAAARRGQRTGPMTN